MEARRIVVVGAGVTGLTTALLLSRNPQYNVTVAAKHMPGDIDIDYASPWAGANFSPMNEAGTKEARFERDTWHHLRDLARSHPEVGVHFQRTEHHHREKDGDKDAYSADAWWKDVFSDFRVLPQSEMRPGIDRVLCFTSVCINTAIYLPWLVSQCLQNGVFFRRAVFKNICDAAAPGLHGFGGTTHVVVNCTGLSAAKLGGVEDKDVYPVRGQTVLVRNEADAMYIISGNEDGADEVTYVMTRAAGGGTILGGCRQEGSWESQPDPNLAVRIMKRSVDLCPSLTDGQGIEKLSVIRHNVGLRPARVGGIRLEKETIGGIRIVHSYGHSGYGYQTSYACAEEAVKLVDSTLKLAQEKL